MASDTHEVGDDDGDDEVGEDEGTDHDDEEEVGRPSHRHEHTALLQNTGVLVNITSRALCSSIEHGGLSEHHFTSTLLFYRTRRPW